MIVISAVRSTADPSCCGLSGCRDGLGWSRLLSHQYNVNEADPWHTFWYRLIALTTEMNASSTLTRCLAEVSIH
jgi:hypothetical protein